MSISTLIAFLAAAGAETGVQLDNADWTKLKQPSDMRFQWTQVSPGDGGTCWYLRIHPADPDCVVQSCDMSSTYVTNDGSKTYTQANHPDWIFPRMHYVSAVDFCTDHPDIGYATCETNGMFKTFDRGRTWERVNTSSVEKIFDWKFKRVPFSALGVHPSDPDNVWAGIGFPRRLEFRGKRRLPQGLIHSADGGKTWQHLPDAFPKGEMALEIRIFKSFPGTVLVGTDGGVHISRDGGKSWQNLTRGLPGDAFLEGMDAVVDPKTGKITIAVAMKADYRTVDGKVVSSGGIWRCDDPGAPWKEITGNLRIPWELYQGLPDIRSGKTTSIEWMIGVNMLWNEFRKKPEIRELYQNVVLNYHKDPAPFHRLWDKERARTQKIADNGKLAAKTCPGVLPDFHTVRIDPRNTDVVYTSIFNIWPPYGVWKTVDGGRRWFCVTRGAQGWKNDAWSPYRPTNEPPLNIQQVWTAMHPMNYGTPQLTFGFWDVRKFDLAGSRPDTLYFHSHRVTYRSTDGGRSWFDISNEIVNPETRAFRGKGNSNMCVFGMAVHPENPRNALFWMADCGLKRSTDGGRTMAGIPDMMIGSNQFVMAAAFDPGDPNRFYTIFNCNDWLVGGLKGNYFLESRDFGNTISGMKANPDGTATMPPRQEAFTANTACLLVDPASPRDNRRFLVSHAALERCGITSGAVQWGKAPPEFPVLESRDHGKTWQGSSVGIPRGTDIVDLVPVPDDFNTIYAAAAKHLASRVPGGLFVSRDAGRTWTKLDTPIDSVTQVVPLADGRIFIAGGLKAAGKKLENRGGVFVLEKGAAEWKKLLGAPLVSTLAVHPADPILYCTVEPDRESLLLSPGVWRSEDGGKTWKRINNGIAGAFSFTFLKWHPTEKNILWLGTYGSGYYFWKDPKASVH